MLHLRHDDAKGFTLFEALVAIALVAVLLTVYGAMQSATFMLRRGQYNVHAAYFIQEALDSARTVPYADLTTRTNGTPLGVAYERGPWGAAVVSGTPSGTKALTMETAQTAIVEETGITFLPGNWRDDATIQAKVLVPTGAPAGWGAGIAFRYRDPENHYRLRFSSGGIALDKVVRGTRTTVWSNSSTYNTNTWYTIQVAMSGNTFTVHRNGSLLGTPTDSAFTEGDVGLITLNSARGRFDDVSVTENAVTTTWNFDSTADGTLPSDWQRFGPYDMLGGTITETIANYLSSSEIKQLTVTMSWNDGGGQTRSASGTTLIAE